MSVFIAGRNMNVAELTTRSSNYAPPMNNNDSFHKTTHEKQESMTIDVPSFRDTFKKNFHRHNKSVYEGLNLNKTITLSKGKVKPEKRALRLPDSKFLLNKTQKLREMNFTALNP